MRKRILDYMKSIDIMLAEAGDDTDWENEIKKHLIQIEFFMHERLIHLIVTMVFAIMTIACIFYAITYPELGMLLLIVAFMILLIPYIMHYYLLENGVQKMYVQYDEMLARKEEKGKKSNF